MPKLLRREVLQAPDVGADGLRRRRNGEEVTESWKRDLDLVAGAGSELDARRLAGVVAGEGDGDVGLLELAGRQEVDAAGRYEEAVLDEDAVVGVASVWSVEPVVAHDGRLAFAADAIDGLEGAAPEVAEHVDVAEDAPLGAAVDEDDALVGAVVGRVDEVVEAESTHEGAFAGVGVVGVIVEGVAEVGVVDGRVVGVPEDDEVERGGDCRAGTGGEETDSPGVEVLRRGNGLRTGVVEDGEEHERRDCESYAAGSWVARGVGARGGQRLRTRVPLALGGGEGIPPWVAPALRGSEHRDEGGESDGEQEKSPGRCEEHGVLDGAAPVGVGRDDRAVAERHPRKPLAHAAVGEGGSGEGDEHEDLHDPERRVDALRGRAVRHEARESLVDGDVVLLGTVLRRLLLVLVVVVPRQRALGR
mmetsp:Transcript_17342/g.42375  ORF Transcript_17342/g.42375 Transcript_17342/m.42375 type:complete len:418 (+) Transcript_17342:4255-5508(+)